MFFKTQVVQTDEETVRERGAVVGLELQGRCFNVVEVHSSIIHPLRSVKRFYLLSCFAPKRRFEQQGTPEKDARIKADDGLLSGLRENVNEIPFFRLLFGVQKCLDVPHHVRLYDCVATYLTDERGDFVDHHRLSVLFATKQNFFWLIDSRAVCSALHLSYQVRLNPGSSGFNPSGCEYTPTYSIKGESLGFGITFFGGKKLPTNGYAVFRADRPQTYLR